MSYQHHFLVKASLAKVAEFHRHSASMAAITPPPIIVRVHHAPEILAEGDEMDFTMWLGPLPLRWLARVEATSEAGFTDRQIKGPFAKWVHRHKFIPVDDKTTDVHDQIEIQLRTHPIWFPVGLGMWLGLPLLFAFREWKTKRILE
jgi:ligand-binding SRPBCC domain-containing protein